MARVLFKKEDQNLLISISNLKLEVNLEKVTLSNDTVTNFFTELSTFFVGEDFNYSVDPIDAENEDKINLFIRLVKNFVETYKSEFEKLRSQYENDINSISTKVSM
jgi:hypothetical protein